LKFANVLNAGYLVSAKVGADETAVEQEAASLCFMRLED
jgi:hypothetical protein